MRRALLAVALAAGTAAGASAQVVGPVPNAPPPGINQTATLLFNAQLAVSRAAAQTAQDALAAQNAQAASLAYQQAIQRYRAGDVAGARTAAIQALLYADRSTLPQPIPTLQPPAPGYAPPAGLLLLGGNVGQIDAAAFVAQARGAVAACVAAHDPRAATAAAKLGAAERAQRAGNWNAARAAAHDAVDLCASARRATGSP